MKDPIANIILGKAKTLPKGGLISARDFLGSLKRPAIDQALSRLAKQGHLIRIGRGLYTKAYQGHLGAYPASTPDLLSALAKKTGEKIVNNGAMAANILGLSQQVPMKEVYLTSGRSRNMRRINQVITLRHAPSWQLLFGNKPEGQLIRALASYGKDNMAMLIPKIRELRGINWGILSKASGKLPIWMEMAIKKAVNDRT